MRSHTKKKLPSSGPGATTPYIWSSARFAVSNAMHRVGVGEEGHVPEP